MEGDAVEGGSGSAMIENIKVAVGGVRGITAFVLGAIAMAWLGAIVLLPSYDGRVEEAKSKADSERGKWEVQKQEMQVLSTRINYLESKLTYKPEDEKVYLDTLTQQRDSLDQEVQSLRKVQAEYERLNKEAVDAAATKAELGKAQREVQRLQSTLHKYERPVVVERTRIDEGHTWVDFGGQAALGLVSLNVTGYATINFAAAKIAEQKVKPGDQIPFLIGDKKYVVTIETVQYVGSYIEISVHRSK